MEYENQELEKAGGFSLNYVYIDSTSTAAERQWVS